MSYLNFLPSSPPLSPLANAADGTPNAPRAPIAAAPLMTYRRVIFGFVMATLLARTIDPTERSANSERLHARRN
jgi:hypothetical protein